MARFELTSLFLFPKKKYVLPPKHVVYVGAVGKDELADQLRAANDKEGVQSAYQVTEGAQTGACAVLLTGHDR